MLLLLLLLLVLLLLLGLGGAMGCDDKVTGGCLRYGVLSEFPVLAKIILSSNREGSFFFFLVRLQMSNEIHQTPRLSRK